MYPNLKLQLWKSGLRQNRLAKMLGMDETALSRIVNGFRDPSMEVWINIADASRTRHRNGLFSAEENNPAAYGDKPNSLTAKSAAPGE